MAHNTLNVTTSPWAWCSLCPSMQRCFIVTFGKCYMVFLTSYTHSTWGCASQTLRKVRSRVGAHLSELTGNWAKSKGWALFHGTTVHIYVCMYEAVTNMSSAISTCEIGDVAMDWPCWKIKKILFFPPSVFVGDLQKFRLTKNSITDQWI